MPAVSKQQQKFMGLVLAYKRGEVPASKVSKNVKQVAAKMSEKELEKFAGTKHKGLPKKVESTNEGPTQGPRWEYEDARGVKKKGTFVKSIERSGTDVTYVFKGDDGKEDLVSGQALKKAKRIQGESVEIEEAMTLGGVKLSAKAEAEVKKYNLQNNQEYLTRLKMYADSYSKRKPTGTPAKNMLKALRMSTWHNTPDDWARLHATEYFMRKRSEGIQITDESKLTRLREKIEKTVRSILREGEETGGEDEKKEPLLTPEQKKLYIELIGKYNQYGESVYRHGKLKEAYKNIKKIVEFASKNIVDESGDWFDGVTLSRHSRKMNESFKIFEKTVMEITKLQQRLESVYEEIGETLGKYYEIEDDGQKKEPMVTEKLKEADEDTPFGPVGMKSVTFQHGNPTEVIGQIITSKGGGRKITFILPLEKRTYEAIVQKILRRFPHTGFGANVKGAEAAYEEFKKMAIDKGIDVKESITKG